jgi:hydroxymethylpyrimidine pyrophosphatase-like HAD family hydrolase
MRYQVLCTDYDGTIAHDGVVDAATVAAMERLLASGRRLVLVTGRELPELLEIFPRIDLFEWVVAENGALLYRPSTKEEKPLADPPAEDLVRRLRDKGCTPFSVGRVIVATREPYETVVLEAIRDLGLEQQVIFNKGAVMVLPAGVNKASGLTAALAEMGLSPHNAVAVGDAENDHAMLRLCEFSCAVANALPAVKDTADLATRDKRGAGVQQLIAAMLEDDLRALEHKLTRHHIPLGDGAGGELSIPPFGPTVLVAGPSASGKSSFASAMIEALVERKYQFCIIDPEGDYESFGSTLVCGGPKSPPVLEEVEKLIAAGESVVVSLTGMPIPDRPPFFIEILPRLLQMRARSGRPHWVMLDEAHHLMPAEWQTPANVLPESLHSTLMVTVHPEMLSPAVLGRVSTLVAVGKDASITVGEMAKARGIDPPSLPAGDALAPGEALVWNVAAGVEPARVRGRPSKTDRRRHRRKYAEGELPPDRSFWFRGPKNALNLRAQNLMMFLQLADGVDDETWEHHRRQRHYSMWFRDSIKDEALAAEAARVEGLPSLSADEGRKLVRAAVERDYTLPASPLPVAGAS